MVIFASTGVLAVASQHQQKTAGTLRDLLPQELQPYDQRLEAEGLSVFQPDAVLAFVYLFNEVKSLNATIHAWRVQRTDPRRNISFNPDFGEYLQDSSTAQSIVEMNSEYREDMNFFKNADQGVEGAWRCSECGSTKTKSKQKQVRSADEGTTTFIKCMQCSKVWVEQ